MPFEGVAPAARILSVKVNSQASGNSPTTGSATTLAQGIIDAAALGAQVINVSIQTKNTPELSRAVRFALSKGAVIVAAGGNDGTGTGTGPFSPRATPTRACCRSGRWKATARWPRSPTWARAWRSPRPA